MISGLKTSTALITTISLGLAVLLCSCATPAENIRAEAARLAFEEIELVGTNYRHIAFFKPGKRAGSRLHVYLEGDGSPWLTPGIVAADPTAKTPVMLGLMGLDTTPSLYLNRPCYMGLAESDHCNPLLWTHRRYSVEVIASMAAALNQFLRTSGFSELVFLAHSGGGAVAVLLAEEFPQTVGIVTLAGNLDIDAWTDYHNFDRLQGSINPAGRKPLNAGIWEYHYIGSDDKNILPEFVLSRARKSTAVHIEVLDGFDHSCCWHGVWPAILGRIARK
jgi:pimeloyl-ACP methyl ester carboxylesterase